MAHSSLSCVYCGQCYSLCESLCTVNDASFFYFLQKVAVLMISTMPQAVRAQIQTICNHVQ